MQQTDENGKQLSVYNDDLTGTSFDDPDTMRVFEEWTDFYTKYNLPKEYSFFNRFRVGMVPLAIQTYGQYSALSAAAPEIKGKWAMAEIPGYPVLDKDGNYTYNEDGSLKINNSQAGFGSACMILKDSEHKDAAWKMLKWWMSTDTQYRYALDIESILGVAGRYTSANVNATLRLDWGKGAENIIAGQWQKVQELAEIPGGYYVSRAIDQAFWNVLSMNENPKDMMRKWGEIADLEITTKIEQYKQDEKEESK
jgi:ABC-type glycerol-3-phosphate transport system substrate-binding protein